MKQSFTLLFFLVMLLMMNAYGAKKSHRHLLDDISSSQDEFAVAILESHNKYRSDTALGKTGSRPMAKDMTELVWDAKLANEAKVWANQCIFEHDSENSEGENLYAVSSSRDNIDPINGILRGLESFYEENVNYNFSKGRCSSGEVCGHYTQMVWAKTLSVGCGYAECSNIFPPRFPYQMFFVCRYSPAGNWFGEKPYLKTNDASAVASICPNGYNGNAVTGLCEIASETSFATSAPPSSTSSVLPSTLPSMTPSSNPSDFPPNVYSMNPITLLFPRLSSDTLIAKTPKSGKADGKQKKSLRKSP